MKVTKNRSLIKSISYRVIGFVNTFLISFLVINDGVNEKTFKYSLYLALLVLFVKAITYYLHERFWNIFDFGRLNKTVNKMRSFFKALTWRIAASTITLISAILITSNLDWTKSIVIYEFINGILIYYVHERIWNRVNWGRIN